MAADGYLREQDLFQIRVEDVVFRPDDIGVAVLLGRGHRGESCKTGRDQGVVFDEPLSREIFDRLVQGKRPSDRVFRISPMTYRKWWRWAAKRVMGDRADLVGPPHSARHTGASRDLTESYRSLEEVMKRGRWKSLTAVHRYAKPHAWYACIANLPKPVLDRGNAILRSRAPRLPKAV